MAVYPKKTDMLTLRSKCIFDPFNTHSIQISKDLKNVDEELALFLNIIPGQKLCKRCKETAKENMKASKKDCENSKDDQDSSYLSKDFDRSRFNSSAEALGFSPIKSVGSW